MCKYLPKVIKEISRAAIRMIVVQQQNGSWLKNGIRRREKIQEGIW